MTGGIVALLGNPNCGKTTLFNALTGTRQTVGNWPGVTVERKSGRFSVGARSFDLVDLPGTYSLGSGHAVSLDERIARDYALSGEPQLVVNIIDASNIERNLYLTIQLIELGLPVLIALNMMDIAKARGVEIDIAALSAGLGCPVVPIVAKAGTGIEALKAEVARAVDIGVPGRISVSYPAEIEEAVAALVPMLDLPVGTRAPRWVALELLEGDDSLLDRAPALAGTLRQTRAALSEKLGYDPDTAIAGARYDLVAEVAARSTRRVTELDRQCRTGSTGWC